eukprot:GHVQ01007368.1.p1 GENE.GHVQ01007368.1~~GHVQ01007368.1.p1  ORF type:complete len:313 (+),score=17.88 GHVQ01007368.1:187-1125(+)
MGHPKPRHGINNDHHNDLYMTEYHHLSVSKDINPNWISTFGIPKPTGWENHIDKNGLGRDGWEFLCPGPTFTFEGNFWMVSVSGHKHKFRWNQCETMFVYLSPFKDRRASKSKYKRPYGGLICLLPTHDAMYVYHRVRVLNNTSVGKGHYATINMNVGDAFNAFFLTEYPNHDKYGLSRYIWGTSGRDGYKAMTPYQFKQKRIRERWRLEKKKPPVTHLSCRSTQLPTLPTTTTTEFVGSSKLLTQTTTHKLAVTTTRAQLNAGQLSAVSLNWIVGVSVAGAALIMTGLGMLEDVYAARPCNHMLLQYYLKP